jgi:hypothetical protein
MSSFEEHKADTLRRLGKTFDEVHIQMDRWHSKFGGKHRFVMHHTEGVEEIRGQFGDDGAKAAECHIRLDCGGKIPKKEDYQTKKVDFLGYGDGDYKVIDKRSGLVALKENSDSDQAPRTGCICGAVGSYWVNNNYVCAGCGAIKMYR